MLSLGAVELKKTFILRLFYSAMVKWCVICHIKLLFRSETKDAAKLLNQTFVLRNSEMTDMTTSPSPNQMNNNNSNNNNNNKYIYKIF